MEFDEWYREVSRRVNDIICVSFSKPRFVLLPEDVHDDWFCGRDPHDTADSIMDGRHRSHPGEFMKRFNSLNVVTNGQPVHA